MRRSNARDKEYDSGEYDSEYDSEYESADYESGEYESGEFESAEYEPPRARKSTMAPMFAMGGIAAAFLAVILAYYYMIYKPEQKQAAVPPPKVTEEKEEEKGPDLGAIYQKAVDFAEKNPDKYLAVVKCFEDVAEALKDTPYEEKAREKAAEADRKWTSLGKEALDKAKEKADGLVAAKDYDAAIKAAQDIPEDLLPPVKDEAEELVAGFRSAAAAKVDGVFRSAVDMLDEKKYAEALEELNKVSGITYTTEEGDVSSRVEEMKKRITEAEKEAAAAAEREIQDKIDANMAAFDALVTEGKYKDARTKARDALQGEMNHTVIAVMNAAADLATVLIDRKVARENAMLEWTGKDVTLKINDGREKIGTIRKFSEKEIEMQVPFKKGAAIGSVKQVIDVGVLADGEIDRLLPPPRSTKPDEHMADAVTALNKGNVEAAKKSLTEAAGHPLEKHFKQRLGM